MAASQHQQNCPERRDQRPMSQTRSLHMHHVIRPSAQPFDRARRRHAPNLDVEEMMSTQDDGNGHCGLLTHATPWRRTPKRSPRFSGGPFARLKAGPPAHPPLSPDGPATTHARLLTARRHSCPAPGYPGSAATAASKSRVAILRLVFVRPYIVFGASVDAGASTRAAPAREGLPLSRFLRRDLRPVFSGVSVGLGRPLG